MPTPRLKTYIWVDAYRVRLRQANIPVFIVAKGDPDAGAVLVKQSSLDGQAMLFQRALSVTGSDGWIVILEGTEAEIDEKVKKELEFDRDLWILEVEDKNKQHLLDEMT